MNEKSFVLAAPGFLDPLSGFRRERPEHLEHEPHVAQCPVAGVRVKKASSPS